MLVRDAPMAIELEGYVVYTDMSRSQFITIPSTHVYC